MPNDHQPHCAGSSDDLKGFDILLGRGFMGRWRCPKQNLELLGANVSGAVATIAEAERLLAQSRLVHSLQVSSDNGTSRIRNVEPRRRRVVPLALKCQ